MKNSSKRVLATAYLAFAAANSSAQPVFPDSIPDVHRAADQNPQTYSQARSLTRNLPLDLMAVNEPAEFEGLPVTDMEGVELGSVLSIARKKSDQSLHAIITTAAGASTALRLEELTLGTLAYWDPAGSLDDQHFQEADYTPISQYQTGHSAFGSLTNPTVSRPVQTTLDQQSTEPPVDGRLAAAAAQTLLADAASRSDAVVASNPVYQPIDSSIVQLALNHPDAFPGKVLTNARGETLGRVAYLARNLTDQELYAVVDRAEGQTQAAVKLSALTAGQLFFAGRPEDTEPQQFDESEFEKLARH